MRGHIRRRGKDAWQVVVEAGVVDGKRRQQYRTVRGTKRDAELVLARMLVERGVSALPSDPTVGEIVEQHLATRDYAATTLRNLKAAERLIPDQLKRTPAWRVRGPDLSRIYRALVADGKKVDQVFRMHVLLSASFTAAVRWGVLQSNPAAAAEPVRPPVRPITPPDPDDVARLIRAADPELRVIVLLAATTGMRRGEVLGLQWGDVDLLAGVVRVRRSIAYAKSAGVHVKGTKTNRERVVALGPGVVAALAEWYGTVSRIGEPSGFVFSRRGDGVTPLHPDHVSHRFRDLCDDQGLPSVRLHDLRHAAATQLIAAGHDIRTVAGRLGHARVATTLDRYAAFVPTADRRAAEHLETQLGFVRANLDNLSEP